MRKAYPDSGKVARNKRRLDKYKSQATATGLWSTNEVQYFIELNSQGASDVVLCEALGRSLASIQYMRRKVNLINRLGGNVDVAMLKKSEETIAKSHGGKP